ncbi:MAG: hypothetical protein GY810_22585 [Aureispira sp.]|nr:hypothetical protein [Aureispira sp.]
MGRLHYIGSLPIFLRTSITHLFNFMDEQALEPFLVEFLGKEYLYIINDKTLKCIADYERFMQHLMDLTDLLKLDAFHVVEEGKEQGQFDAVINGKVHRFVVEFREDWIDADTLMIQLNKILEDMNAPNQFYWFWDCTWGIELGFFFVDHEDEDKIFEFIRQRNQDGYQDQVSNGEVSVGTNLEY